MGNVNLNNPAALGAFMRGDMANAAVASKPGGIEAQEKQGQTNLCALSSYLPKDRIGCTQEDFERMGIVFGDDVDDLFVSVTLPDGWKIQATNHSMHSELLDDKGNVRAQIFYKAAFYDRRADITIPKA